MLVVQEALDNTLNHVLYIWLSLNKLPWASSGYIQKCSYKERKPGRGPKSMLISADPRAAMRAPPPTGIIYRLILDDLQTRGGQTVLHSQSDVAVC